MITDIRLQSFRSYNDDSFEISPNVNIIVGPNASGKTNLLEAVMMISRGSSYRVKDIELIKIGAPWARIDAHTPSQTRVVKIQTTPLINKTFEIDGQKKQNLQPTNILPTVLFEPNHLLLLSSSPDLRRNFLDDLIEQTEPGFMHIRKHYKRVVTQRNTLLKKNPKNISEQLFVWNIRLSELGGKIARSRNNLIERFQNNSNHIYQSLAGGDNKISLSYKNQFPIEQYETKLLNKLESSTQLDVLRGFTAYGPHREDMEVCIDGYDVTQVASRGESRTLVLMLKIMELQLLEELNNKPLLLLDDVFSELDTKRRQALTSYIVNYQTFITTTDADVVINHFTSSNIIPLHV